MNIIDCFRHKMTDDRRLHTSSTSYTYFMVVGSAVAAEEKCPLVVYRIAGNFRIIKFSQFLQFSQMIDQQRKFSMRKFTTLHHFQLKTGKFYPRKF